jgi:hypothetical protein
MDFHVAQRHRHAGARRDGLRPLAHRRRLDSGAIFRHQLTFPRFFTIDARSLRVENRSIISFRNILSPDEAAGGAPVSLACGGQLKTVTFPEARS